MRASAGTPRLAQIYGYVYDIDTETLSLVAEDEPAPSQRGVCI
jgi:hypothetical protein